MQVHNHSAVQQNIEHITLITPDAPLATATHGRRAKFLQRLVRLDIPVPCTVALSFEAVRAIAEGSQPDRNLILAPFEEKPLLCARPSSEDPDWGGPGAMLNIGMNDELHCELSKHIGPHAAATLYLRFVQSYAVQVEGLDPDLFETAGDDPVSELEQTLSSYMEETKEAFPQDPSLQLMKVLQLMARSWETTSARLLRMANGAPADASLGLVVQKMMLGMGRGECGSGVMQLVGSETGKRGIEGRYLRQNQGREDLNGSAGTLFIASAPGGASLEDVAPGSFEELRDYTELIRAKLREELQIEFTIQDGRVYILDGIRSHRTTRAAVTIAVALARDGIISREEALMRVEPRALNELLHRQIDPEAPRDVLACGIAASPGAASGRIVFTAGGAQSAAAKDELAILVRRETNPEDIRGMHAAAAVLTMRGGMSSHAAVIGRGIGLPCVVGASDIELNAIARQLTFPNGRVLNEGDIITIDGTSGEVLFGEAAMHEASSDSAQITFMEWADDVRDIAVRANADTPADARAARSFRADGIGLCRTEHMFIEADRLRVMREMIFADSSKQRAASLELLLPMQRADFIDLFRIMEGKPVCIRLFDPPLHEFLPSDHAGHRDLAEAIDLPLPDVTRRVEELGEYNPMLGMRGVRLGIVVPEIYEMQARAIFEAMVSASREIKAVVPEIMIPLVSACKEVELVKQRIDAVADAVMNESNRKFAYRLGVMVETPRAALMADDIARHVEFLSFGTNDLTQMTYGLSRDDSGKFMSEYVKQGVYPEDPFHTLDVYGVGELLNIAAERSRKVKPDLVLSICGEHGGNPESIAFCRTAGFDYVSCSPFRVPVARLAVAQLAVRDKRDKNAHKAD